MTKVHWLMYLTDPVWQGLFYIHLHDWFIHSLSHWVILSSQSSRHHKSQTVRTRDLNFWEYVHPPPCVTSHMSGARCHVSGFRCHMSCVRCHMYFIFFPQTNWRNLLVDGLLSTGPTPSSLQAAMVLNEIIEIII